ncbi:HAD family hydrolase [Salinibacter ruber]|uniref:HAD family hydrolase n=1 Tax=Salinibacter ruber TaxID=146919 RepID=UPI002169FA07|nr:HAD family hydrolase [Salinibacter ruber]MCS4100843.1 phosphoglycolate phosphatase-like HAD superfamily hydrolase [Salinibacter ruber]
MNKTVILDLDGTILDTSARHYRAYVDSIEAVLDEGPLDLPSHEDFWASKRDGKRTVDTLPDSFPEEKRNRFESQWIERIEQRQYLELDQFVEGVTPVLESIEQRANRLLLVTHRSNETTAAWQLDEFGIADHFDKMYIVPHNAETKQERLRSEEGTFGPKDVMIGDSEADIRTAHDLGIVSIAVTSGVRSRELLEQEDPTHVLAVLTEATKLLRSPVHHESQ